MSRSSTWSISLRGHDIRHTRRVATIATAATLLAVGCGGDSDDAPIAAESVASDGTGADSAPVARGVRLVQPVDVAPLVDAGVTVIDVRTPDEFASGHIDGATMIDFYEADFAERIAALDPDGEYLVYCRSGNRSGQAVALMAELGFADVADLDGGVLAYQSAGLDLVP